MMSIGQKSKLQLDEIQQKLARVNFQLDKANRRGFQVSPIQNQIEEERKQFKDQTMNAARVRSELTQARTRVHTLTQELEYLRRKNIDMVDLIKTMEAERDETKRSGDIIQREIEAMQRDEIVNQKRADSLDSLSQKENSEASYALPFMEIIDHKTPVEIVDQTNKMENTGNTGNAQTAENGENNENTEKNLEHEPLGDTYSLQGSDIGQFDQFNKHDEDELTALMSDDQNEKDDLNGSQIIEKCGSEPKDEQEQEKKNSSRLQETDGDKVSCYTLQDYIARLKKSYSTLGSYALLPELEKQFLLELLRTSSDSGLVKLSVSDLKTLCEYLGVKFQSPKRKAVESLKAFVTSSETS